MGSYSSDFPASGGGITVVSADTVSNSVTSSNSTQTTSGAGIDFTKSLLLPSFRTSETADEANGYGRLTASGSELVLTRGSTGNQLDSDTKVIEFSSVTSAEIYPGTLTGGSATTNVTITSADQTKAMISYLGAYVVTSTSMNQDDITLTVEQTSDTNVLVTRTGVTGQVEFSFQVVVL